MHNGKMTAIERRGVASLSCIIVLRMIGLFMVLPVFALYASSLDQATPVLIGIAVGIYGLSQALLQIPFGMLSDQFGRKRIIFLGLILFIFGSLLAGITDSIYTMIIARTLQGAGAVGSTLLALMADLTRENQRTKAMAIAGISIGFSFSLAMFLGPTLINWLPVNNLFYLAASLGVFGIIILYTLTPTPTSLSWHRDTEPELRSFFKLLKAPELAKLNVGILFLHAIFTASFVVIPLSLNRTLNLNVANQWHIYLPSLVIAFFISLVCIAQAERKQSVKPYFLSSILFLAVAELFLLNANNTLTVVLGLGLFFVGFSVLEAFLPSLVSRTAPVHRKGTALGIYSCAQFLGIFMGGVLGGWLYGKFSFAGVYLFCFSLSLIWLLLAIRMQPPRYLTTHIMRLVPKTQLQWETIAAQLRTIPGIVEMTFIKEDSTAYLKLERKVLKHPDFLRIQEQLSS